MKGYGLTDRGKVRKINQDSFRLEFSADKKAAIAVVCDGMGGAKAGEVASELAAEAFLPGVRGLLDGTHSDKEIREAIADSIALANKTIFDKSSGNQECEGMGTTLVSAIATGGGCHVANIGDSRAYLLTPDGCSRITEDHSVVAEMVRRGDLTPEQARVHPMKNLITRVVGVDESVSGDIFTPELKPGYRLLLCSDGLSNMVRDEEIFALHKKRRRPDTLCKSLLKLALERGATDNVTVVVLEV